MTRRVNALVLVMVMAIAPLVPMASAHPSIGLSTDVSHVILSPGEATNLTLTIDNNGSAIESYTISVSGFDNVWEVIPTDSNVSNVIPTLSATTTIAIRLATTALPSNSGTLTITVTEPDANVSSTIDVQLSVLPRYLPSIDATAVGDNGLVNIEPGDGLNLSISVTNNGNVDDTILLSVDQSPDLVAFWSNWSSGGNNNSGNNTSGNNTGGNNTGGNNTSGNNTGGNNTSGNNTGGNNTSGNNTGGNNTSGNNTGGNSTGGNNTGNGSNGVLTRSIPSGWEVRFADDLFEVMTPSETRVASLIVSTPSNAAPGYYGFKLFAASSLGNFSVNTTLVVNISATHDLSFSHTNLGVLLPGENSTTKLDVTSLSTSDGNWTWASTVVTGDCSVDLSELQSNIIEGQIYEFEAIIAAGVNTHVNDECKIRVNGVLDHDSSITEEYEFSVYVGEEWGLAMVLPSMITLDVETEETFNIAVTNNGTEEDTISLVGIDSEGITFTNPEPVTLQRGESQYIVVGVTIDSSIVGDITLNFSMSSTKSGSETVTESGLFEVREFAEFSISGPSDNRVIITPGENSSVSLNLTNQGTRDLEFTTTITGLPNGITVVSGLEEVSLMAGESTEVTLQMSATSSLQPTSISFTVTFDAVYVTESIALDLQITDRNEVSIDAGSDRIIASPVGESNLTMMVTNLGTSTQTFVADIDNNQVSDYFSISVDKLTLTLASGESGTITVSAIEVMTGAPESGLVMTVSVLSATDSTVADSIQISIIPTIANGQITVLSDKDSGKPGETINGNIIITNLGTSTDTMRINSVDLDCGLMDAEIVLAPSMSSSPIPWSCTIPADETAGVKVLNFRLTSASRSDMVVTFSESYTVEPSWSGEVISFTFGENDLVFDESIDQHTISVTICNEANTYIEGNLELIGKNEPQMDGVFFRAGETGINSTYSLASKGCQDFKLMLTPLNLDGFDAKLTIHASSQVLGQTVRDVSPELRAKVGGPVLAPDGMDLGILELNNKNSIILLSSGWALAAIMLLYVKLFRKPVQIEEEEEVEEEVPLGHNEVRIDEYNKVTCTSCEARLGVPEGSEPPFRFTCPQCETRIRVVE